MSLSQTDKESVYQTKPSLIILSLVLGAVTGASVITGLYLFGTGRIHGLKYLQEYGLSTGLTVFKIALIPWMSGLILFAGLPWWLLHRWQRRSWWVAVLLGLGLTLALQISLELYTTLTASNYSMADSSGQIVVEGVRTAHGWKIFFLNALQFGAIGAFVSLIIWRIAYRRVARQNRGA